MKKIIFLIFTAALILACEGPKGENGKNLNFKPKTGIIIGFVELYNNLGNKKSDCSLVRVELKNKEKSFISMSDTTGKYTFKNLPLGFYNITYTRYNYSTYKLLNFNNIGDTCYIQQRKLYSKITTSINKDIKIDKMYYSIELNGTFKINFFDPPNLRYKKTVIAYISKYKNVSPNNYEFVIFSNPNYKSFNISISRNTYKSGTTVYVTIYGITNLHDYYYNKEKRKIYPNLSESNSGIIEVKIP